jgi:hypothetical protein
MANTRSAEGQHEIARARAIPAILVTLRPHIKIMIDVQFIFLDDNEGNSRSRPEWLAKKPT